MLVLNLLFLVCVWAQDEDPLPELSTSEKNMIQTNQKVSEWLDGVAEALDIFLAGDIYSEKPNHTKVEVETSVYYTEFQGLRSAVNFNVDLKLPNTEEYWLLTFNSYDDQENRGVRNDIFRQSPRNQNVGAAISWIRQLGSVKTTFRPRIGSAGGLPAISHSLMFESVVERDEEYWFNPKFEFYANAARGAGAFQGLNFYKKLSDRYGITIINEGDYQSRAHLYQVTHGASLGETVAERRVINYNIYGIFKNEPNYQFDALNLSVMWRHNIYPNVFRYEIMPSVSFEKKYNFAGNGGLTVNGFFIF